MSSSCFGISSLKDENFLIDAVRCGHLMSVEIYLNEQSDEILNQIYSIGNNKLTLLMMACFYKHENLVRMILKRRCSLSIDLLGTIEFDSSDIHPEIAVGVPALWIATAMNHLNIVRLLIEHGGADINQMTQSQSTAFRVACFNGNLELCKYLAEHGANVHQAREGNYTNLMVAAHWKHFHIVKYLIEEVHVNPHEQSEHGRTALHNAVQAHENEIIRYFLEKHLPITRDTQSNLTPLLLAVKNVQLDSIDLFEKYCSIEEWIEAKEFLGAIYSSQQSSHYHLDKAYQSLAQALILREKFHLRKITSRNIAEEFPLEGEECQTLDQLNHIRQDVNRFHIQSLFILERILGCNNDEYYYSLRFYGACLIDSNQFYRGLQIWIYQINLAEKYAPLLDQTEILRTFVHLFTKMQQNKQLGENFRQSLFQIISLTSKQNQNTDFNIHTLLYLFTLLATALQERTLSLNDSPQFSRLLQSIIRSNHLRTIDKHSTLLHLSVNSQTEPYYHYKYPCLKTISFLIQFGISIDQMDKERNTALHLLIGNNTNSSEIDQLIDLLYEFGGAHLDLVNIHGQTPVQMTNNLHIQEYFKKKRRFSI